MSEPEIWLVIIGLTVVTAAARNLFLMLPARYQLPERYQQGLRYAPACALVAIIAPDLAFGPDGGLFLEPGNHRLIAAVVAALLFYRIRKLWLMIVVGMGLFTLLRLWD